MENTFWTVAVLFWIIALSGYYINQRVHEIKQHRRK